MSFGRVGVVMTSYGDLSKWQPLRERAAASVAAQTAPHLFYSYHWRDPGPSSLGALRNCAALEALDECDRLIFLDADDELDPHYIEEITKVKADIVQPATLGIRPDGVADKKPIMLREKPLIEGNYIVIGACINARLFQQVGGFRDQPIYEDWDLWLRMYNAGATIGKCPKAVYRVHVNDKGRNSDVALQQKWYNEIKNANSTAFRRRR